MSIPGEKIGIEVLDFGISTETWEQAERYVAARLPPDSLFDGQSNTELDARLDEIEGQIAERRRAFEKKYGLI